MLSTTYAPKDIAQRWGCKADKVLALIATRELIAVNVATNRTGGKPRWRITPEALAEFERSRTTLPKPVAVPRRRRTEYLGKSWF